MMTAEPTSQIRMFLDSCCCEGRVCRMTTRHHHKEIPKVTHAGYVL
jgi:hypothetical protein